MLLQLIFTANGHQPEAARVIINNQLPAIGFKYHMVVLLIGLIIYDLYDKFTRHAQMANNHVAAIQKNLDIFGSSFKAFYPHSLDSLFKITRDGNPDFITSFYDLDDLSAFKGRDQAASGGFNFG